VRASSAASSWAFVGWYFFALANDGNLEGAKDSGTWKGAGGGEDQGAGTEAEDTAGGGS